MFQTMDNNYNRNKEEMKYDISQESFRIFIPDYA